MVDEIRIRTERLELVASTPEMARAELSDRDRVFRLLGSRVPPCSPPPLNDEEVLRWNAVYLEANPGSTGWTVWYFLLPADSGFLVVGNGGFKGRPDSAGMVEVGYAVLEEHQGQGYATEAVQALVEWALSHPEVRVVEAETDRDAPASARVLEKCGFGAVGGDSEEGLVRYRRQKEPLSGV